MTEPKEFFPYDISEGAACDYADGQLMIVIKDDVWSDEELALARSPLDLNICYTNGLVILVLEGGPVDSSDFYFNVQECEQADELMSLEQIQVSVMLVDGENHIAWKSQFLLSKENSDKFKDLLSKQKAYEFMPGEYDVNIEGMQMAYEPFELNRFSQFSIKVPVPTQKKRPEEDGTDYDNPQTDSEMSV